MDHAGNQGYRSYDDRPTMLSMLTLTLITTALAVFGLVAPALPASQLRFGEGDRSAVRTRHTRHTARSGVTAQPSPRSPARAVARHAARGRGLGVRAQVRRLPRARVRGRRRRVPP